MNEKMARTEGQTTEAAKIGKDKALKGKGIIHKLAATWFIGITP